MTQFRKKPVVIDAIQYNNLNKDEIEKFVGATLRYEIDSYHYDQGLPIPPKRYLFINTLEGEMRVDPMDYVIKGIKGEFYPCKPDIFEQTYEPSERQEEINDEELEMLAFNNYCSYCHYCESANAKTLEEKYEACQKSECYRKTYVWKLINGYKAGYRKAKQA